MVLFIVEFEGEIWVAKQNTHGSGFYSSSLKKRPSRLSANAQEGQGIRSPERAIRLGLQKMKNLPSMNLWECCPKGWDGKSAEDIWLPLWPSVCATSFNGTVNMMLKGRSILSFPYRSILTHIPLDKGVFLHKLKSTCSTRSGPKWTHPFRIDIRVCDCQRDGPMKFQENEFL